MYLGSVRFFKHLIIIVICIAVVSPITLSVILSMQNNKLEVNNEQIYQQYEELKVYYEQHRDMLESIASVEELNNLEDMGIWTEDIEYQDLYPDMYVDRPVETVYTEDIMYLTFDDGPSERTLEVLDILDEHDVKATFFVTGQPSSQSTSIMQEVVKRGHTIAAHTYTHQLDRMYTSVEAFLYDFYQIYNLIYESTGVTPDIFRFAGGSINSSNHDTYRDIIVEMTRRGFVYFDWNLSSGDAVSGGASEESIINNILSNSLRVNRGVVLMHDSVGKWTTVAALDDIIIGLKEQGFGFDKLTNSVAPVTFTYID